MKFNMLNIQSSFDLRLLQKISNKSEVEKSIYYALNESMNIIKHNVITTIQTGVRTGRPFRKRINGKLYVGRHSAPGEPIANITGKTADTTYQETKKDYALLGSKAEYSGDPEYGTSMIIARRTYAKQLNKDIDIISHNISSQIVKI